jgi:hypothetical protein
MEIISIINENQFQEFDDNAAKTEGSEKRQPPSAESRGGGRTPERQPENRGA